MEKLKILAASDIEGDTQAVKRLVEKAVKNDANLVILCGDLTNFDMETDGLVGPFLEKNKQVLFITGNHDMPAAADFISKKYNVKNLQHYAAQIGDIGIFGCGGANIGPNFMDDDDMFYYLRHGFEKIKDCRKKIMVTHVHPAGSRVDRAFFFPGTGSHAVERAIQEFKPDIHVCGHMHEFEGIEDYLGKTKLFSVGKHGTVFEI